LVWIRSGPGQCAAFLLGGWRAVVTAEDGRSGSLGIYGTHVFFSLRCPPWNDECGDDGTAEAITSSAPFKFASSSFGFTVRPSSPEPD